MEELTGLRELESFESELQSIQTDSTSTCCATGTCS